MCVYLVRCGVALRGSYLYVRLYLCFCVWRLGVGRVDFGRFFFSIYSIVFFFLISCCGGGEVCIVGEWSEACVCDGREGAREGR